MTRYSRSVIPGRPDSRSGDSLDRQLFGDKRPVAANEDVPQQQAREAVQRDAASVGRQDFRLLPDEDGGYRPPPENRRTPILMVGVALTVVVFGAVVFNAYRQGVRPADAEVAPQLASIDSFKTKPAPTKPASTVEPAQAAVFDAIESGAAREVRTEPEPAPGTTSAPAPTTAPTADLVTPAAQPRAVQPPVQTQVQPPVLTPVLTPAPTAAATVAAKPAPAPTQPAATISVPVAAAPSPSTVPVVAAPKASAPSAPSAPSGAYKPPFSAGGAHLVQVAAAGSEADAIAEWNRRARSWPELLQGAERVIVRADVNGRTVYRVRAGAFATAADADGFCTAVKGRGGDCFRTAR